MQAALRLDEGPWFPVRDGDPRLRDFYNRHYSSRGGDSPLICGPGEKLVLLTHAIDALFVWRRFRDMRDEPGVNCAVFRNESGNPGGELIRAAELLAFERWGSVRLYTYVNAAAIRSTNPGYCFQVCGWRKCATTPGGHGRPQLIVLEKLP